MAIKKHPLSIWLIVLLAACSTGSFAADKMALSPPLLITSQHLKYTTQFQVYLPAEQSSAYPLATLYLTDGPWFSGRMRLLNKLNQLLKENKINPIAVVFLDHRQPDNLNHDRRDKELLCNISFIRYLTDEVIPMVEERFPVAKQASKRVIAGLSFGGLNAACTGLAAHQFFSGIGMISPVLTPSPDVYRNYQKLDKLPLKFFLSTGTRNDNQAKTSKFRAILRDKGYQYRYKRVKGGHDFDNFESVLDDLLIWFFAPVE